MSCLQIARIQVPSKLIRRSLESTVLSVAKLKLADLEKKERTRLENHQQFGSGKATFYDRLTEYLTRLEANHIPTVSCWLGHKDGGALAMKVYGHLRDSHSVNMAQKVTFSEKN